MTEPVQATPPPAAGLWEDFIDILHQPSQVFDRRRDGQFGLALLILVLISGLLYFALQNGIAPVMDAEISRQMAEAARSNPQLTTIWTLVLVAIGLSVVARVTLKQGAIAAAMVWAVGVLPGLFQALRQG